MAKVYTYAYFNDSICPIGEANLSIASSAVLYGLSVYTVFPVVSTEDGAYMAFRLDDHFKRLADSAKIIGIDTFALAWTLEAFTEAATQLVAANKPSEPVFVRATVHVNELVPGTRSRGLSTVLSMFMYEAAPIMPLDGARLKTSVWRRIPDYAIPSRAKVNGAYVNSVLAKQDAIDSGYDDCIFLDAAGHVCELSAANIFIVRQGTLITPDTTSDLLEGISRRTVLELAQDNGIKVIERTIDLTELYIAEEVFVSGTSAYVTPVLEIDARKVNGGVHGPITQRIRTAYTRLLQGDDKDRRHYFTPVGKQEKQPIA